MSYNFLIFLGGSESGHFVLPWQN